MTWSLYPIHRFGEYLAHWRRLNADGPATPLLDEKFVLPLLQVFARGDELLACHRQASTITAMAIVHQTRPGVWQTFQPSQAPLGLWLQSPDLRQEALLDALLRKLPGFPLVLGVMQQDPMHRPRPRDGHHVRTLDYISPGAVVVAGGFEAYWSNRGKNLRQNLRTQRNKLARAECTTRLELSRHGDDAARAIAEFGALESAGWKGRAGTAIHESNAQGTFYRQMMEAFCRAGAGRIYRYWYGDKLVAMNLCIEGNGAIFFLKIAYDESLKDGTSPALLMRQEIFEGIFERAEFDRIEFYSAASDLNARWCDDFRTLYHVNWYRWPILARLKDRSPKKEAAVP